MIKKIIFTMIIFLFISPICISDQTYFEKQGKTYYVGGNDPGNYNTIQDAIDNASSNDTVFVYKGIYKESIVLYKKINLIAESGAILEFDNNDNIVLINADGSKIKGFTIRNCIGGVYFGLKIGQGTKNVTVENNFFENNSNNSLYLYYTSDDKIINNSFSDDGIFIVGNRENWNSHIIENNRVNDLPILYYKNQISTSISDNKCGQIIIANISSSNIKNNYISGGKLGISIGHSENNNISNNHVKNTMFAIRLQYSDHNVLRNNCIENNSHGFFIQHSNQNIITKNNISYNNIDGCHLCCGSTKNIIFLNNFVKNTKNAYDIVGNIWHDNNTGNFWDDYTGFDENHDYVGDISYNISSKSSDPYPLMKKYNNFLYEKQDFEINNNSYVFFIIIIFIISIIFLYFIYNKYK